MAADGLNNPQPPPKPGTAQPTWELVIADMQERDATGAAKYGVRHQHDNGRDHLVDAYQECLDQALYLRAAIEHRRATMNPRTTDRVAMLEGVTRSHAARLKVLEQPDATEPAAAQSETQVDVLRRLLFDAEQRGDALASQRDSAVAKCAAMANLQFVVDAIQEKAARR